jgi:hypothetical protein
MGYLVFLSFELVICAHRCMYLDGDPCYRKSLIMGVFHSLSYNFWIWFYNIDTIECMYDAKVRIIIQQMDHDKYGFIQRPLIIPGMKH